jgi:hypothetical protein
MAQIKEYFESDTNPQDARSPLSGLFWKSVSPYTSPSQLPQETVSLAAITPPGEPVSIVSPERRQTRSQTRADAI